MGALLATLSSLLWGTSDFLGGTLSRRVHPVAIIRASHALAAVVVAVVVTATGEWGRTGAIGWGVAAGIAGAVGLSTFYAALASGTMGVVAPIAAAGVVVPVAVGLAQGDEPGVVALVGIVVTIVGVVLVTGPERSPAGAVSRDLRPLLLALVAAVSFGSAQVLVAQGSEASITMTVLSMRVGTVVLCSLVLAIALRSAARPARRDLRTTSFIAFSDTGAIATFSLATTMGDLSIAAVLASLYPGVTALLAWRVHGEHLRRVQVVGGVTTLVGVALIAGG
ncbi:DMT family transporter [Iamia sp. SCSIO 61187]|uniref:DMT family transporter n=1 Tax=Iamia sp. SCSIO 61187 TaxID=2722752 RepID=UPI001C63B562|nr:DMT family transporter [Iamia sp. SCSIO 61187]QYG92210.1 DMT family transporter [Iamia sp. SCSIO 61187]